MPPQVIDAGNVGDSTPVYTAYCQYSDLTNRLPTQQLCQLSNDTNDATTPNHTVLGALAKRGYDVINLVLGSTFTVPMTTTPGSQDPTLLNINVDLTCVYLMQRRFSLMELPEEWQKVLDACMETLSAIASLKQSITSAPTIQTEEARIVANDPLIDFYDTDNQTSDF